MRRIARSLVYLGVVAVVYGLSTYHGARIADPPYEFVDSSRFAWAVAYVVLLGLTAYGVGLPDLPRSTRSAVASALAATVGAALGVSALQLVVGDGLLPRFVVFGTALLLVPWFTACAALARVGTIRAEHRDRVVMVGSAEDGAALRSALEHEPERPATLVATIDVADAAGTGESQPLVAIVGAEGAQVVVLDRAAQSDDRVVMQAAVLHGQGIRVRTTSLFYEQWLGKLPLSELERVSLLFDIGEVHRARYGRMKRILDVAVGGVGMVVLVVAVPVVLLGNLVANRGPLLYRQPRVGKNGRVFSIVKFRTMRAEPSPPPSSASEVAPSPADGAGTPWTAEDDPRITPWGRILRTTHVDEVPQVWNILRGDLSIVGPRPEQPRYVDELTEKLPFYGLRHVVRPGLTGWAQVKYHYASDEADALEKLQYEFFYLRHQDIRLDLRIIGRTVRSVLGRQGR